MTSADDVTRLLGELPDRPGAFDDLIPIVYDELRSIARARLRGERTEHTLQPTALVHEACLRLLGPHSAGYESRGHFFRAASEAMRRVLVDHARRRAALRRGGGRVVLLPDDDALAGPESGEDAERILAVSEALDLLAAEDARAADVVRLRFFGGFSAEEAAEALGVAVRSVHRDWAFAKARLQQILSEGPSPHD